MAERGGPPRRGACPTPRTGGKKPAPARKPKPAPAPAPPPLLSPGPFRLGAFPGATPGKWIDIWKQRMPRVALELVPLDVSGQRDALLGGDVDAALVRLPIERSGLHTIPLYDDAAVVVCAAQSHLTAADELTPADLAGEVQIIPADDVTGIRIDGTAEPRFAPPETTADAVATVAAGVGIVIVPMSLARLHHRKDVTFRPLLGVPASAVALAWREDDATDLVDVFVGIVRGRTANSSRH